MFKDWKNIIKNCLIVVGIILAIGALIWFATFSLRQTSSINFYKTAQKLDEQNKPNQAVLALEKSIFLNLKNDEAFYLLGKIHRENLAFGHALTRFKRAYFLKPENDLYFTAFAESALKLKREDYLIKVLNNRNVDDLTNTMFVITYLQKNDNDTADSFVDRIKDKGLKNYLSTFVDLLKNPDRSINNISFFKKFPVPQFVSWHLNINSDDQKIFSDFEKKRGQTKITETKKLLVLNLFCDLGFGNLVVSRAKKLVREFPSYRDASLILGRAQFMEQDYEGAKGTFESALGLDPNYLPTLEMLAKTYYVLDLADEEMDIRTKIEKLKH